MNFFGSVKKQFLLAHVSGIPVRIDYRWFIVLALMSWITALQLSVFIDSFLTSLIFGLLTTIVLFVSIFLHELAHAFAARMERVEVVEIVLHPFGGLSRLRKEPDTPRAEFRIAIAGPVASFLLAVVFLLLMAVATPLGLVVLVYLFFFLALWNFLIAVFNLFPGYPLDGGRVLRAYLWKRGADLDEATVLTGKFGKIIAVALMGFGLAIAIFRGDIFTGFWTVVVGLFLYDAAKSVIRQISQLEKVIAEDVMLLPVTIAPEATVSHFVDTVLPLHRRTIFLVARDKQFYGVLKLEDFKSLPRPDWHKTTIQEIMRPVKPEYFVETDTPLADARVLMRENGLEAVGVIDGRGNLVGFLQLGRTAAR